MIEKIKIALAAVCIIIFMPVLIPFALLDHKRTRRRMKLAIQNEKCVECGETLGESAIRKSDEEWAQYMKSRMDSKRGMIPRVVRPYDAICEHCGKHYKFLEDRFRPVEVEKYYETTTE